MGKTDINNMGICKIDARNRITLPPTVMQHLNLNSGNHITIEEQDGVLKLYKAYFGVRRNNNGNNGNGGTQ